jgi:predicted MFS family arabinose efflux permease
MFCVGGVIFFVGFNMLEPILQSAASKYAKAALRGKALATFTSFQYLGVLIGGVLGGFFMHQIGSSGLLWALALVAFIWFLFALFMTKPPMAGFAFFNILQIKTNNINSIFIF